MNYALLRVAIAIAAVSWLLCFALFSAAGVQSFTWEHALAAFGPFSTVCTFMVALGYVFNRWIWKWPGINQLLAGNRRDISGTWQLTLHSDWKNPQTGQGVPPIEAYMRVFQTYSHLHMIQLTKESQSESVATNMICTKEELCEIAVVYTNDPRPSVQHRSKRHFGAFRARVSGNPATAIDAEYWTERPTTGEMHFMTRVPELFDKFELAQKAFPPFEPTALVSHFENEMQTVNKV